MAELNTLAPKKWVANYSGVAPTIDTTDGVSLGDFAIDSSNDAIWRCLDNTDTAAVWVKLGAGTVTSGAGSPSSTPVAVGDTYHDTTNKDWYIAQGTSSSADWHFAFGQTFEAEETTGGVTQLALTGFPVLREGVEYELSGVSIQTGAGSPFFGVTCNNETADTNYTKRGVHTTGDVAAEASTRDTSNAGYSTGDGQAAFWTYRFAVVGTSIRATGTIVREPSGYGAHTVWSYDNGSAPPTRFDVLSSVASKIDSGTKIRLRRIA